MGEQCNKINFDNISNHFRAWKRTKKKPTAMSPYIQKNPNWSVGA